MHIDQRYYTQAMGTPNAKIGRPEDVASTVSYLVSPEAHFITGQSGYLVIKHVPIVILRPDYHCRRWHCIQLKYIWRNRYVLLHCSGHLLDIAVVWY
jgi:hypothetical protein